MGLICIDDDYDPKWVWCICSGYGSRIKIGSGKKLDKNPVFVETNIRLSSKEAKQLAYRLLSKAAECDEEADCS